MQDGLDIPGKICGMPVAGQLGGPSSAGGSECRVPWQSLRNGACYFQGQWPTLCVLMCLDNSGSMAQFKQVPEGAFSLSAKCELEELAHYIARSARQFCFLSRPQHKKARFNSSV